MLEVSLKHYNIDYRVVEKYNVFINKEYDIDCESCTNQQLSEGEFDALISLGGDGTMLDTLELVKDSGLPVMVLTLVDLASLQIFKLKKLP